MRRDVTVETNWGAGLMRILALEKVKWMVVSAEKKRQAWVVDLEKETRLYDREVMCLDEKCLDWNQKNKWCRVPQEELGQNLCLKEK